MTVIINQSTTPQEFSAILRKMYQQPRKTFNARQFCGKVKFHKDPIVLQKMWRDEW